VTESQWLSSRDPVELLDFLGTYTNYDRRALRLFIVNCVKFFWDTDTSPTSKVALQVAEKYADGLADADDLSACLASFSGHMLILPAARAVVSDRELDRAAVELASNLASIRSAGANMVRDIFPSHFRPSTTGYRYDPCPKCGGESWFGPTAKSDKVWCQSCTAQRDLGKFHCPWRTPEVLSIAMAAYETTQRACLACNKWTDDCVWCNGTKVASNDHLDPVRLKILADALEEEGCSDEELLQHLRGQVRCPCARADCQNGWQINRHPHFRGCWALDFVLEKRRPTRGKS
jgi:hypothetical protein